MEPRPAWVARATAGVLVLVLGQAQVVVTSAGFGEPAVDLTVGVVLAVLGSAVVVSRWSPGLALALTWAALLLQVVTGSPYLVAELGVGVVGYATARWGSRATVAWGGISIPLAAVVLAGSVVWGSGGVPAPPFVFPLIPSLGAWGVVLLASLLVVGVLVVPWLVGLVVRLRARAGVSEVSAAVAGREAARAQQEAERAQEMAERAQEVSLLREQQAQLARDVHDVVGHSLAVILAQAESGQYLPDEDPAALKSTLATIATSARSSLRDVRHVLAGAPQDGATGVGGFEGLVEGVRSSGRPVVVSDVGSVQPLPPELAAVAHRVVQEMFTNALRHGSAERPVEVERCWPDAFSAPYLRIRMVNGVPDDGPAPTTTIEVTSMEETAPLRPVGDQGSTEARSTGQEPTSDASVHRAGASGSADRVGPAAPDGSSGWVPVETRGPGTGLPGMGRRLAAVGGRLEVTRRPSAEGGLFRVTAWVPVRVGSDRPVAGGGGSRGR